MTAQVKVQPGRLLVCAAVLAAATIMFGWLGFLIAFVVLFGLTGKVETK